MDERQKNGLMLDFTRLMIKKQLLKQKLSAEEEQRLQQIPKKLQMTPTEIFHATFPLLMGQRNSTTN